MNILLGRYIYIDYAEIMVSTLCTLRCRDCAAIIPRYYMEKRESNNDINDSIMALSSFLNSIDELGMFRIIGGEPLVHPELIKMLEFCSKERKIDYVQIVTNGTLIPKENLIECLKDRKFSVHISNYGSLSNCLDQLEEQLRNNGIIFLTSEEDAYWTDFGPFKKRKETPNRLKKQFRHCKVKCNTIIGSEIHRCIRSATGKDLEIIPVKNDEYVDLRQPNSDKQSIRRELKRLLIEKKYISACDYCMMASGFEKSIPAGIQVKTYKK